MAARARIRTLPLAGMAAAGVVFGHWVAYRLAIPASRVRADVLAHAGHAYWFTAVKFAVVLGIAGTGAVFVRHLRRTAEGELAWSDAYAAVVLRLALLQLVAFTAIEALERMASGAPVTSMLSHGLLLVGLAVQFLIACAGGIVVVLVSRTARLVASAFVKPRILADRPAYGLGATPPLPAQAAWTPSGPRAPPRS